MQRRRAVATSSANGRPRATSRFAPDCASSSSAVATRPRLAEAPPWASGGPSRAGKQQGRQRIGAKERGKEKQDAEPCQPEDGGRARSGEKRVAQPPQAV